MPTPDEIEVALGMASHGPAHVLAAAYRAEKDRADQNEGAFDAQDYWHKRAELAERQYAELKEEAFDWACAIEGEWSDGTKHDCEDMLARHEDERKAAQ